MLTFQYPFLSIWPKVGEGGAKEVLVDCLLVDVVLVDVVLVDFVLVDLMLVDFMLVECLLVECLLVVLLAKVVDVFRGSRMMLLPSSSLRESGARVHAGASDVRVLVPVIVVVVSKPGIAPPQTVTVASIIGTQREEIMVDDVPRKLEGSAETLKPSVHHTKRSVTIVLLLSSQSSGSGRFGGFVGAGPGFGPQPPGSVHPGREQSSGGQGSHPFPGQYPPYPTIPSGCVPGHPKNVQGLQPKRPQGTVRSTSNPGQPGPNPIPIHPQPHPKSLQSGFFSFGREVGLGLIFGSSRSLSLGLSLSPSLSHFFGTHGQMGRFVIKNVTRRHLTHSETQSFGLHSGSLSECESGSPSLCSLFFGAPHHHGRHQWLFSGSRHSGGGWT